MHWTKVVAETTELGCLVEETTDDTGTYVILAADLEADVDLNDPSLPCWLRRQAE